MLDFVLNESLYYVFLIKLIRDLWEPFGFIGMNKVSLILGISFSSEKNQETKSEFTCTV